MRSAKHQNLQRYFFLLNENKDMIAMATFSLRCQFHDALTLELHIWRLVSRYHGNTYTLFMQATLLKNAAYFNSNWNQRIFTKSRLQGFVGILITCWLKQWEQIPQRFKNTALYHSCSITSTHALKRKHKNSLAK